MRTDEQQTLLIGAGGIGGVLACALLTRGQPVTILARRPETAARLREDGLVLREGGGALRAVRGPLTVCSELPQGARFREVLLAVPPDQVESAAHGAAQLLSDDGVFVVLQNGLCEERLAARHGPARVVGAVVAWGASSPSPGVYERTSAGGFVVGTLEGGDEARADRVAALLACAGPVTRTRNLRGARFSKLALNCAVSSLGTLGGERLGAVLVHRHVRRLALELMTEAVEIAQAEGVLLEKVAGTLDLRWVALTDEERKRRGAPSLFAKHALLLAVGARYRRLRSSMLTALAKGQTPPVDYLNGELVERGARLGIETPINTAVTAWVHALARGERRPCLETLRALYDETRGDKTHPALVA